jgi:hypothetical protein
LTARRPVPCRTDQSLSSVDPARLLLDLRVGRVFADAPDGARLPGVSGMSWIHAMDESWPSRCSHVIA